MTWLTWHEKSELAAAEAHLALHAGDYQRAENLFCEAAEAEKKALDDLDPNKIRTLGVTAVSATALYFKGKKYAEAEAVALRWLGSGLLPPFAATELRVLVQNIWVRLSMEKAGVAFLPGQVLVSISGGQVITGGAPLDLIVEKVQTVQSIFYRTIELIKGLPHRARGGPTAEIQEACRPWLFQAAPGSYQFSVAVQEPKQIDFFAQGPSASQVAENFLSILRASNAASDTLLQAIVPQPDYRMTFQKLTRNLAPTGKNYSRVELRSVDDIRGNEVVLGVESRRMINQSLKQSRPQPQESTPVSLRGVLRGVHLDHDWLEVVVDGTAYQVNGLSSAVDDLIGPMVNHRVVVHTNLIGKRYAFVDVESDE